MNEVVSMSFHDYCRLCNGCLRINGTLSNTKRIFESNKVANEKSVAERLRDLGLTLSKDSSKSVRICRSCFALLKRLEDEFAIFRRWQEAEKAVSSGASTSTEIPTRLSLTEDTGTTLPELTEQHRIRLKEEELSGLESVHMAGSETVCAALGLNTLEPECVTARSRELHFCTPLSSSMMQAGVCLRQDTETTLPELTEQHRISLKEEELSGLESVHMAESETECAAPGLNTLEPVCVTAQSGVNEFSQVYILNRQQTIYAGERPHKCIQCGKCFSTKSHLNSHQRIHTGEKPYKCTECGKCFSQGTGLKYHHMIHTGEKPYRCSQCGKFFRAKHSLTSHKKTHAAKKSYLCTKCGKCFFKLYQLNNHERIHEKICTAEKPYKCTQCEKRFSHASSLRNHKMWHSGEKPYKCTQCGKSFAFKSALNVHIRVHTGEKPYRCTECGKCFSKQASIQYHKMIHTGEKPYKCTQCGKCFRQKYDLDSHKNYHTGKKSFMCAHCGKCFFKISQLNDHERVHTGEKPYRCSQCGQCFSHSHTLKQHKVIHSGKKPHRCLLCGRYFSQKGALNRHSRVIHPDNDVLGEGGDVGVPMPNPN